MKLVEPRSLTTEELQDRLKRDPHFLDFAYDDKNPRGPQRSINGTFKHEAAIRRAAARRENIVLFCQELIKKPDLAGFVHFCEIMAESGNQDIQIDALLNIMVLADSYHLPQRESAGSTFSDSRKLFGMKFHEIIERVAANLEEVPSRAGQFSSIMETLMKKAKESRIKPQLMYLMAAIFRDMMCLTNSHEAGKPHDGFAVEDFRADCLFYAKNEELRRYLSNRHPDDISDESDVQQGIINAMRRDKESCRSIADFKAALFDQGNPRHKEARAILKKIMFSSDTSEAIGYALSLACFPTDEFPEEGLEAGMRSALAKTDVRAKVNALMPLIREIYGASGVSQFSLFQLCLREERSQFPGQPILADNTHGMVIRNKHGHESLRLVKFVEPDEFADDVAIAELDAEKREVFDQLVAGLADDIKESTVALENTGCDVGNLSFDIKPIAGRFPACVVAVISEERLLKFTVNEQLEIEDMDVDNQMMAALRAIVIATIHDNLTVAGVRIGEAKAKQTEAKPAQKRRAFQSARHIIISSKPEDPQIMEFTVKEGKNEDTGEDVMTVRIDRRSHWADLAPELTYAARQEALDNIKQRRNNDPWNLLTDQDWELIFKIITDKKRDTHRLNWRQIFESVFARDERIKTWPVGKMIEEIEGLELDIYNDLLLKYKSDPHHPMPRIFEITRRMEADKDAAVERGTVFAMPDRRKPTQTFRPHARYEMTYNGDELARKVKNYLVIKGESSLAAVKNILGLIGE